MSKFAGVLLLLALVGCASTRTASPSVAMTFEDLGCDGDWPTNEPQKTTVVRTDTDGTTSFQVRHSASCGLSTRKPAFSINGDALTLRYEMYSPDGAAILCDCDYRAKFNFTNLPPTVKSASFEWSQHER